LNAEKYYARDRAAYLRRLALETLEPQLRTPYLKAAADQDAIAKRLAREKGEGAH